MILLPPPFGRCLCFEAAIPSVDASVCLRICDYPGGDAFDNVLVEDARVLFQVKVGWSRFRTSTLHMGVKMAEKLISGFFVRSF